MLIAALLATLQAAAGPPAPVPERLRTARQCPNDAAGNGDVVVCARTEQEYRLKPLADNPAVSAVPRARATLAGNVEAAADVEQASVGGFSSNRIMLRLTMPF